jgi:hypothetical protein
MSVSRRFRAWPPEPATVFEISGAQFALDLECVRRKKLDSSLPAIRVAA